MSYFYNFGKIYDLGSLEYLDFSGGVVYHFSYTIQNSLGGHFKVYDILRNSQDLTNFIMMYKNHEEEDIKFFELGDFPKKNKRNLFTLYTFNDKN